MLARWRVSTHGGHGPPWLPGQAAGGQTGHWSVNAARQQLARDRVVTGTLVLKCDIVTLHYVD